MAASVLKPRKQPQQQRARATYDAILEASARIISKGGLAAFNTNAVASRAGVSIGSLYQYFPDKDAIMAALIERSQSRQAASLEKAASAAAQAEPVTQVRMLVRAAMQHHRDDALLASAIDHEEARLPVGAMLDRYMERAGATVRTALGHHADKLIGVDLDRAAWTLPAIVRAVVDVWSNRTPPALDEAEDEAVRAVLGYLGLGASAA